MIPPDRDGAAAEGASPDVLNRLRAEARVDLPAAYLDLLGTANGGERPLPVRPLWFALDPAETALETFRRGLQDEFFPGFLMFGSNGGGEYIAFDARGLPPWPIVYIDMTNSDLGES